MSSYTQLVLNSDGLTSTGSSYDFTTTLSNTITLNAFNKWEVAVVSLTFPTPNPYTNKAIYVECNLVDFSYVDGTKRQLVYKTNMNHETPLENELTHVTPINLSYVRLTNVSFNSVNIKIQDSDGNDIPNTHPSSVTLSIRSTQ